LGPFSQAVSGEESPKYLYDGAARSGTIADWLEGRLPKPVEDITAWPEDE